MVRPGWAPEDIDVNRPSVARVYDYYLGGSHNFAVDRAMAEKAMAEWPELPVLMAANRGFLRRAVRFCIDSGVRQFLDLGSGIPTVGNVHEVAQSASAQARVVYVDVDPIAVAHSRAILAGNEQATAIQADLRNPAAVLRDPLVRGMLDLSQPVAVLLVAVLHFVSDDDDPAGIVSALRSALVPGSLVVISHASQDGVDERAEGHRALYARAASPMTMRNREQIAHLLDGLELVPPGVSPIRLWRPEPGDETDGDPASFAGYAAVGRVA